MLNSEELKKIIAFNKVFDDMDKYTVYNLLDVELDSWCLFAKFAMDYDLHWDDFVNEDRFIRHLTENKTPKTAVAILEALENYEEELLEEQIQERLEEEYQDDVRSV